MLQNSVEIMGVHILPTCTAQKKNRLLMIFFSFLIPQSTYFLEDPAVFFTSRHLMRAFYYPCFIFCQPARPRKRAFFQPTVIRIDFKRRDVLQKILVGGRIMLKKLEKKIKLKKCFQRKWNFTFNNQITQPHFYCFTKHSLVNMFNVSIYIPMSTE